MTDAAYYDREATVYDETRGGRRPCRCLARAARPRSDADLGVRVATVADRLGLRPEARTSFTGTTRWASAEDGQVFRVACFRRPEGP